MELEEEKRQLARIAELKAKLDAKIGAGTSSIPSSEVAEVSALLDEYNTELRTRFKALCQPN